MPDSKARRVFIVDDEIVIASTLGMILRQKGFDALAFTDPLEALKAARMSAPDLLISDVIMPEISGIELAIQTVALCPDCKILLFSGQAKTACLLEDASAKGYEFALLSKPIHPKDLLTRIAEAFELSPQP